MRTSTTRRTYQPAIDLLEDRTVPALFRPLPVTPVVAPATHFQVVTPQYVETGKAFNVTVTALDATNKVATGFKGTVQLKISTADTGATLPASFTFSAADRGKHTFQVMLKATLTQTVSATSGALTGNASVIVNSAVTHFGVYPASQVTGFTPTMVNIVALDAKNKPVPGYTGTVHFTSTDLYGTLPKDYTFTAADAGSHIFSVTFASAGKQSLGVKDIGGSSAGTGQTKVVLPWYYYYPVYANYYPYSNMNIVMF